MASEVPNSNSNSNNPSPSLLREVREAFKQLHESASVYLGGSAAALFFSPNFNPPNCNFSSSPSSEEEPDQQNPNSSTTLDEILEQLKLKALSLKERRVSDRERISELNESLKALRDVTVNTITLADERRVRLNLTKPPAHEIDDVIAKFTRMKEMTEEIVELLKVPTDSRLASFHEIERELSQIRRDLQQHDEDFVNELMVVLKRGSWLEARQLQLYANKLDDERAFIQRSINNYVHVRHNCCCTPQMLGHCRQEIEKMN